jgi:ABC-type transporter Mla subunit MlaD
MAKRLTNAELTAINDELAARNEALGEENDNLSRSLESTRQEASHLSNLLDESRDTVSVQQTFFNERITELKGQVRRLEALSHTSVDHLAKVIHDSIDTVQGKGIGEYTDTRLAFRNKV